MVNWYDLTITRPWVVPRCCLRESSPSTEKHDLPSFPRSPIFLPYISFTLRLVVSPLSLPHAPSCVCSNTHLPGGVTIEKAVNRARWELVSRSRSNVHYKDFMEHSLPWEGTRGTEKTSSYAWVAKMQINKCLHHCILQRSHLVVVSEGLGVFFNVISTPADLLLQGLGLWSHWCLDQTNKTHWIICAAH